MSKVFFTGCTHFDHANIIGLASRPFVDVDEMNWAMVENHNKIVQPNDEVFHLGDHTYGTVDGQQLDRMAFWNKILNGRKHLILGNHDDLQPWREDYGSPGDKFLNCGFSSIHRYLDLKRKGHRFILFHYPMEDWDGRYRGSIHLHCHTHQKQLERPSIPYVQTSGLKMPSDAPEFMKDKYAVLTLPPNYPEGQYCNRFNVTVEATNYTPISMDEIIARSEYKNP